MKGKTERGKKNQSDIEVIQCGGNNSSNIFNNKKN